MKLILQALIVKCVVLIVTTKQEILLETSDSGKMIKNTQGLNSGHSNATKEAGQH